MLVCLQTWGINANGFVLDRYAGDARKDVVGIAEESYRGRCVRAGAGAVLGMVGPNGAGKTTTLRAIAGIIPPTQGQLRIAGHDVVRQPKLAKQCLAYIPDEPKLFDSLTVWEHIRFIAATYQVEQFEPLGVNLGYFLFIDNNAGREFFYSERDHGRFAKFGGPEKFLILFVERG